MQLGLDKSMSGYIEGYYGKLLNWSERRQIIAKLSVCGMNTYVYAPKEDNCHRLNWKKSYSRSWFKNFKKFCIFSKKKNIDVLVGIAPGLSFNFNYTTNEINEDDFETLRKKAISLLNSGASNIVLLLDDIPDNFKNTNDDKEGIFHAKLANDLCKCINKSIYFVPRIYSNEQIIEKPRYLYGLAKNLNHSIKLFYCGKNIVSKTILNSDLKSISCYFKNKIIFWDNIYANDYCPRKLFLGQWKNRDNNLSILINPTGMIKTDLFLLDMVFISKNKKNFHYNYECILEKHKIPKEFKIIQHYFNLPYFGETSEKKLQVNKKKILIEALDYLLWKWKTKLSREWYPFLLILKQDLKIEANEYSDIRVSKIQTIPLAKQINKNS